MTRPTAFLERCRARYGRRFTLRFVGAPPLVLLADPDEVREVFTAPPELLHPGDGTRGVFEAYVGSSSVIVLDEQAHLEQRKLMLPAFHGERMAALVSLMTQVTEAEVSEWPVGEPIALQPRMQKLTLEVILRAVFGLSPGKRLDELRDRLIQGIRATTMFSVPALQRDFGPFKAWSRFLAARDEADALIIDLLDERRRAGGGDDVLAMLLEARYEDGSPMSAQELRDQLMTMLVAGHDTTGGELGWAFERIMRESAVRERLRHRPVLPNTMARLVKQPFTVGGHTYPPDVLLVPSAYLIHHDAAIYPDPYAFRPERFLESPPGTYTWIPFGGGRRRCIGASFAMTEMKVVLRVVLSRFEIGPAEPAPEPTVRRGLAVMPRRGAMAVLRPRVSEPAAMEPVATAS